jgi:hypothetical protein
MAAGCALLTVLSLVSTFSQIFSIGKKRPYLHLQAYLMLFGALWLLAIVTACDILYATRSSKITATVGGIPVPQSFIQQIQQAIGISPQYKDKWYCTYSPSCVSAFLANSCKVRLCAILPWFAFPFATLSGLLLYSAARNTGDDAITEETESEKIARSSDVKQLEV